MSWKKVCYVDVTTKAWKDNYLFLGNWDLKDDYRYYYESYYKGFFLNSYKGKNCQNKKTAKREENCIL